MALLWRLGGVKLHRITLNAALRVCGESRGDAWRTCLALLGMSRADVVTFSSCAMALERRSKWMGSCSLLHLLQRTGVQGDIVAYGTGISACAVGKAWKLALRLFDDLHLQLLQANVVVATSILTSGCSWSSSLQRALRLAIPGDALRVAVAANVGAWRLAAQMASFQPLSPVAVNVVIRCFSRMGLWESAEHILRSLPQQRLRASVVSTSVAPAPRAMWRRSLRWLATPSSRATWPC